MQLMLSVEGKQEDHDDIELLLSKTSSPGSGLDGASAGECALARVQKNMVNS